MSPRQIKSHCTSSLLGKVSLLPQVFVNTPSSKRFALFHLTPNQEMKRLSLPLPVQPELLLDVAH
jgi:hypothetical protein